MAKFLGILPSNPYRSFLVLAVTLTATIPFEQTLAKGGGIAGYSGKTGGLTCTDCHSAGAALPKVSLTGATSLTTGAAATYKFTINGGPAVAASLDIAASGGTLAPISTGTKLLSSEIVHTTGAPFPASGAVYNFKWTAPAVAGTYTLFAAGLSSNDTGSGGDGTKTTSLKITVTAATPATPPAAATPPPAAQNPTASIVAPTTGVAGAAVSFDASKSTAPTGRTLAIYDWNFGDNTAGSGAKVTHTYMAGSYTATLKVADSTGATASVKSKIVISAAGISAVTANAGGPYTGTLGVPVQFDATGSAAPGGTVSSYTWNFGDNTSGTGVKPGPRHPTP